MRISVAPPLVAALAAALLVSSVRPAGAAGESAAVAALDTALGRAVAASLEVTHAGRLTAVSFGELGPQITSVELTRSGGGLLVERETGWQLGRVGGQGFLRSADALVRVGGVEPIPAQLDRLHTKYTARWGAAVRLDTGEARSVELTERATGALREVLYLDDVTGLIVRRETFDLDGRPVRVVAFTELTLANTEVVVPAADGLDVRDHQPAARAAVELRASGFAVPQVLPSGYELLGAVTMGDAEVPTAHLVYGDGLYTISVFEQQGRMARAAVHGGAELTTPDGGAVWRWPGSEPRRVLWSGDGSTYTALTDAPTDELLVAIGGLPTDPPPSTLSRLKRGLRRVTAWFWPTNVHDERRTM